MWMHLSIWPTNKISKDFQSIWFREFHESLFFPRIVSKDINLLEAELYNANYSTKYYDIFPLYSEDRLFANMWRWRCVPPPYTLPSTLDPFPRYMRVWLHKRLHTAIHKFIAYFLDSEPLGQVKILPLLRPCVMWIAIRLTCWPACWPRCFNFSS